MFLVAIKDLGYGWLSQSIFIIHTVKPESIDLRID